MRKILLFMLPFLMAVCANAQISGTYTISGNSADNPDYTTFSAAMSALSAGIDGEVVFEVAPGTYEEYVTVPYISGASADSRVIFRGTGADNQQVVITSNAGYTSNSTLKLSGCDFVTFENMTLTTTSTNRAVLLTMAGDVDSCRFENVRFIGVEVTTTGYSSGDNDKNLVYMDKASGAYCDGNEFVGCQFINGHIALYLQGLNMTQFNNGILVENCTFTNQHQKSIYITFYNDVIVRGNTITNANDSYNDYNAIDGYRNYKACIYENNVINVNRIEHYTTVFHLRACVGDSLNHAVVRNNVVNLNSSASSYSYCFRLSFNDSRFVDVAHNSFKCVGNANNSNIHVENNPKDISFYNNLLINESNGYIFRFNTNSLNNRFSDYNRIQFAGENFARRNTFDYATMQDWTDSTGLDANSALCEAAFLNDNDLHITSSENLRVENPLAYVTTDIDGEVRTENPCAGADELAEGQNLPPVVVNTIPDITFDSFPASQEIVITNVFDDPDDDNEDMEISIISNTNEELVSAALTDTVITVERLLTTGGTAVITLQAISGGDTVKTSFSVICVAQDLPPVVVNPLEPIVFTTFPQTLTFDLSEVFDDPDNNNLFMEFAVETGSTSFTAIIDEDDNLVVMRTVAGAFADTLTVTATSNGKTVDMAVPVSGEQVSLSIGVADFEDVELNASGHWIPAQEGTTQMVNNGWAFSSLYDPYYWGGFTASNVTDTTTSGMAAQYTAVTGVAHNGSKYAVAYDMGVWAPASVATADGSAHAITGCYVTNNLYAFKSMRDGDAYSAAFGGADGTEPDFFLLHAIGKDAEGNATDTLDFYLADYRFENSEDDYIVDSWKWFDLSPLGEVASVTFTLESSQNNQYGMVTPAYFCIDDFNGEAPEDTTVVVDNPPYIANPVADLISEIFPETLTVNLEGVAADDDENAGEIVYTLIANSNESAVSASIENNTLSVVRLTNEAGNATLTIRATSGELYVDFEVKVILNPYVGISDFSDAARIFPNPTKGAVTVSVPGAECFSYEMYNAVGQKVMQGKSLKASESLDLSHFGNGVYVISIRTSDMQFTSKVIVK